MKTINDLQRGSPVKVRWTGTGQVEAGTVEALPSGLQADILVRVGTNVYEFDAGDVILPSEDFPAAVAYTDLYPGVSLIHTDDEGAAEEGTLVSMPPSVTSGTLDFLPAGASFPKKVSVFRVALADDGINDGPTDIIVTWRAGFTGGAIPENTSVGAVLADLQAVDSDVGDTATFSKQADPDNKFAVVGSTITLANAVNFEADAAHPLTVRVTDSGALYYDKAINTTVTNANEPPTDIVVTWRSGYAGGAIPENTAVGAVLADLSAADPDAGATFTYSEIADPDNKFTVSAATIVLAAALDFELDTAMTQTIRATDQGGLYYDKVINTTVTNVNEAPTSVGVTWRAGFTGGVIPELTATGTVLADLSATDPDAGATFTFSKQLDADSKFGVSAATLILAAALDYETKTTHDVTLRATDQGGLYYDRVVNTTVGDETEATLLNNTDLFVLAGNSYEAQNAANDNAGWARMYSGCKGYAPRHWRHARGGDTLAHLCPSLGGRLPQILAMNPKGIFLMSPQNSMGDTEANIEAQYHEIITTARDAGVKKIVIPTQVRTAALTAAAILTVNTFIRNLPTTYPGLVVVSDRDAVIDMTTAGVHNGAQDHSNAKGAGIIGQCDGAAIASCFVSAPLISDYTAAAAGNLNADWNMADTNADGLCDGWALTNNYTGSTVVTQRSFFRSPGMTGIPCQVLRVSGTSAIDPVTAGNELRLRKTVALPTATKMTGRVYVMRPFVEITNVSADWASATGPVNLAAFNMACGFSAFMTKSYSASNGACILPGKFAGLIETLPGATTSQNTNLTLDVSARPMKDLAADYEIRFGYVMVMEQGTVAYAAPYDQSIILPVGRPAIFTGAAILGTPAYNGGTGSVGITYSSIGNVSGGGMVEPTTPYGGGTNYPLNCFVTSEPHAVPANVVGDIEGARPNGAAAIPYVPTAADVGKKLRMGVQYQNSYGSLTVYSNESAAVAA